MLSPLHSTARLAAKRRHETMLCCSVSSALAPVQLESSKCYLVGVGPGSIDHCTVSAEACWQSPLPRVILHTDVAGSKLYIHSSGLLVPLQVKAVRLISSAQALVYDDLGTQVLTCAEAPAPAYSPTGLKLYRAPPGYKSAPYKWQSTADVMVPAGVTVVCAACL